MWACGFTLADMEGGKVAEPYFIIITATKRWLLKAYMQICIPY